MNWIKIVGIVVLSLGGVVGLNAARIRIGKKVDILDTKEYRTVNYIVNSLPKGTGSYNRRSIAQIQKIVIHHSATTSGTPQAYAKHHIESRGWPGIGYHYVIGKNGEIDQTNDLETISYHTQNQNTPAVGICLTGNYDIQSAPPAQIAALVWLINDLRETMDRHLPLHGHREFASKSCPGLGINVSEIEELTNTDYA